MKAYAYARVSGRGQVDGDGFPRQEAAIQKYAAENGIEIAGTYREKAVPGATEWDDRPAWVEMLDRIVNNGVRTIVIERLDRLARDLMVQEHIFADLANRKITLVSTVEPDLGSTEPTRVMMRQIMGAIAQYDKAMIVLKLRGARQRAKAREGHCEGRKAFGHYPGEAEILKEIRNLADSGETPTGVARTLNERGVRGRGGKPWHPYAVSRILGRQK